jgi:hypothetical protein
MREEDELSQMARDLIWWQRPEVSLANPRRLLAHVMTRGDWPEIAAFKKAFGWEAFRDALVNAESGIFDVKTWTMWHHFFGLPVPELPRREFLRS